MTARSRSTLQRRQFYGNHTGGPVRHPQGQHPAHPTMELIQITDGCTRGQATGANYR